MKRYQEMMPSVGALDFQGLSKRGFDEAEEFILLTANHPLLLAYENYISEIERSNRELTTELKTLKRMHDQLEKESADSYKRLLEKSEELAEMIEKTSGSNDEMDFLETGVKSGTDLSGVVEHLKEEQTILNDEIDEAKEEALKFECAFKEQAQLTSELENKLEISQKRCKELESKLEKALYDREIFDSKLTATATELKVTTQERDELYNKRLSLEGQLKIMQRSLDQYKDNYNDLEQRKLTDIDQLEKELNEKAIIIKETKSKVMIQEREIIDLKNINRTLQRDLEETKAETSQMIKIMEDNENKVALFDDKEKTLKQKEQEARRRIAEAKTREEEFLQREKQYKKQIGLLEDQSREEQDQQRKKYEAIIEASRSRQKTMLDKRDDEYNHLYEKFGRQENTVTKLQADIRTMEEDNRRLISAFKEEQKNSEEKQKSYDEEIRKLRKKEIDERRKAQTQLDESQQMLGKLQIKLKENEQEMKTMQIKIDDIEGDAKLYEEQAKQTKEALEIEKMERTNAVKEIERLKIMHQSNLEELANTSNMKVGYEVNYSWLL